VTMEQIKQTIVTSVEGSFQPPEERKRLAQWFRTQLGLASMPVQMPQFRGWVPG
jgi:hypothetical protein